MKVVLKKLFTKKCKALKSLNSPTLQFSQTNTFFPLDERDANGTSSVLRCDASGFGPRSNGAEKIDLFEFRRSLVPKTQ